MGREQFKSPKMLALELSGKRDMITREIDSIVSTLTAPGGPGLTGNLLDAEGFPRADVDIAGIRAQRNRLAVLRNDYKDATSALEAALQAALPPRPAEEGSAPEEPTAEAFTLAAAAAPAEARNAVRFAEGASSARPTANGVPAAAEEAAAEEAAATGSASDRSRTPFAVVDSVAPGSPAADAQLHVGDRVAVFGAISLRALHSTAAALQALPATVRAHVNRPMDVIVHRGAPENFECLTLSITPRPWAGNGMLGCHVLPLRAEEDARYRPDVTTAVARR